MRKSCGMVRLNFNFSAAGCNAIIPLHRKLLQIWQLRSSTFGVHYVGSALWPLVLKSLRSWNRSKYFLLLFQLITKTIFPVGFSQRKHPESTVYHLQLQCTEIQERHNGGGERDATVWEQRPLYHPKWGGVGWNGVCPSSINDAWGNVVFSCLLFISIKSENSRAWLKSPSRLQVVFIRQCTNASGWALRLRKLCTKRSTTEPLVTCVLWVYGPSSWRGIETRSHAEVNANMFIFIVQSTTYIVYFWWSCLVLMAFMFWVLNFLHNLLLIFLMEVLLLQQSYALCFFTYWKS